MNGRLKTLFALVIVLLLSSFVLFPTMNNGFSNWDDPEFLTDNPDIRELKGENVGKIFTSSNVGLYVPMVILSYAIEYHFFGMNPKVFHATSLILHLLNCALLFWLVLLLSGEVAVSFIVSVLFAIHPLNVESVAWIVERKDVLFAFFYLLSLIAFIYFRKNESRKLLYFLSLAFFLFSLLSKAMATSLVFALFLLDYVVFKKEIKAIIVCHMPFYVTSILLYIVSVSVIAQPGRIAALSSQTLLDKIQLILYLIPFYIHKLILPIHLSARYSSHLDDLLPSPIVTIIIIPLAVMAIWFYYSKNKDNVLFGSLFFLLTLLPVFPLVFMGYPYGDRYCYIPAIGLFYVFAWGCHNLFHMKAKFSRIVQVGLLLFLSAMIAGLSFETRKRLHLWGDDILLWTDVIRQNPKEALAYNNRGDAYAVKKQAEKALNDFNMAIALNPRNWQAYDNRGGIYFQRNEKRKALADFNMALRINPGHAQTYYSRGSLWGSVGYFTYALNDYSAAIELAPKFIWAYYFRAITYEKLEDFNNAYNDYERVIQLDSTFGLAIKKRNDLLKSGKLLKN